LPSEKKQLSPCVALGYLAHLCEIVLEMLCVLEQERDRLLKAVAETKSNLDEAAAASIAAQTKHDEDMLLSRIRFDNKERSALADLESITAQLSEANDQLSAAKQSVDELAVIQASISDMRVTLDKAKVTTSPGVDTYSSAQLYEYLQSVTTDTEQRRKDHEVAIALLEADKMQLVSRQSQLNSEIDALRKVAGDVMGCTRLCVLLGVTAVCLLEFCRRYVMDGPLLEKPHLQLLQELLLQSVRRACKRSRPTP
jgi:DNA repair exonuclease SbcCD ATPase subunit